MKTTIDIPDHELREAMNYSHARTKRDAVIVALSEYNRRHRMEKLIQNLGTFKNLITPQELQKLRNEA